ncbi:probable disease resistance protein At5g63020 isoform X2 [Vicia villosa]|uniref:probable disease resistance protein At5g63020 isoform X2 n=1 Tax=Vicia villosa TaxID=3911 RepID=UPI00273A8585|nr:probable disease resistance protein At5g63020 isoform X2 [Vicia villosa]XP_058730909.1 probable disease resistance protein At5g63020 isoform X2 [Vicia villosa]XP_058730910.1 probable disease resistance protein At5g63020 isoform X2 [Vicia villosa]XP_058730911.1 probable disease resistance protein At5g63020 isoform X2 [Vicia villosa]XP_058730912.1 probable disease resistance protein At5g63020 isoform X2 [Vicia villosa]XP_058730913.1 probable disease resistance protein At5g63020 isoform X2 [Vi
MEAEEKVELQENLQSLKEKWEDLQNKKKDVQTEIDSAERTGVMKRTNEVIGWLQEFQKLEEKMKDIPNSQEVQSNQCLNGYFPKNCVSSYKLGKTIVKRIDEANGLLARARAGNLQITLKQLPKSIEMPSSETIGLDLMVHKVWNSLDDDTVGVIGLYGMGGAGKTTLMKRIHNELQMRDHSFDLVLWVVVSRDCDINKLMNDISNKIGIDEGFWNRSTLDQRVANIYGRLKGKKFLLMLDDLWEKLELDAIGVPVQRENNNKSKVMFTTRFEDVCGKMQAQNKFKVECLSEKEAFDLFCKKVGPETLKCHTEIPKLAHEMAKECGGLPLALITVGSAMAGVESFEAWMAAKNNLRSSPWTASNLKDKVFNILKFSYDKLPDEAHKSCFLYCALYPEDFEIHIDDIIDRWIGEGFLFRDDMSIYDMRIEGKSIIEKLILSCLLEESIDIESFHYLERNNRTIKMHDVIRDMALWLARDEDENQDRIVVQGEVFSISKMDSKRLNVVERISIITATKFSENYNLPACPNLTTVCFRFHGVFNTCNNLSSTNFQSLKSLRVLDLSYTCYIVLLPPEIGEIINLEFLNISGTFVSSFPIEFKKLKNLKVFLMDDMKAFDGEVSPLAVIESLEQLKVFRFSRLHGTVQEDIALLEKLESLPKMEELSIQLTGITSMQRLFNSPKLRGCSRRLRLSNYELDTLEMSSLLASMSEMTHLDCIHLIMIRSLVDGSSVTEKCHLGRLRQVRIHFCSSITHLTWLRYAPLLEYLVVIYCSSIEHVVKEATDDEEFGSESKTDNIFTNLKDLCLENMPKLVSIHKRALNFPSLQRIRVTDCPNLRKLPFNSSIASMDNLVAIQGRTNWWDNLEWDDTIIERLLRPKFQHV